MNSYIEPRLLQGTRDFLPKEMAKRDYVMNRIKDVFVNFGYDTVETPVIEYAETILGKYGDEATELVYRFKDNGGRDIALRYDQTVPFARLVAGNYKNLPMPFKRYQISRVWRADRPAKGRFREFYQCDIDIIGTTSLLAEAEVAAVMAKVFKALGFPNFVIKFNSRRLINSILTSLDVPNQKQPSAIRILDKLEKLGPMAVVKELSEVIPAETSQKLIDAVSLEGTTEEKIKKLAQYEIAEIAEFAALAKTISIPEKSLVFDPSLARGLDYYTGIIFEVIIPKAAIGALCAGGRYDDLLSRFSPEKFSGVGAAFGFDRIITAMEDMKLLTEVSLNSKVLVTYLGDSTLPQSLSVLSEIRDVGIPAEMYFGPADLTMQMKYANQKAIPFVVICGGEEMARGEVTIKMMKTGRQKSIPQNQVVNYFKGIIDA